MRMWGQRTSSFCLRGGLLGRIRRRFLRRGLDRISGQKIVKLTFKTFRGLGFWNCLVVGKTQTGKMYG